MIQVLCVILPVIACYSGAQYVLRLIVLCFIIGVAITTSGRGYLSNIQNTAMAYCGTITMPLYLFHWVVGSVIGSIFRNKSQDVRVFLYYSVSIIVGCLVVEIQGYIKRFCNCQEE